MNKRIGKVTIMLILAISAVGLVFYACGSGGGSGGGRPSAGGTSITTSGIMTKGSVDINGMKFTVAPDTSIKLDYLDDSVGTEAGLQDGMYVHLRGTLSADGVNGTATIVEAEDIVQGVVESIAPNVVVLKQNVLTDAQTICVGYVDCNAIAQNDCVEVYGMRDATGNIQAGRIEKETCPVTNEIKGTVSNISAIITPPDLTFNIGTLIVNTTAATTVESEDGTPVANNVSVEVDGDVYDALTGTLTAAKIQNEDAEDSEFEAAEGEDESIEGYVSGFSAHPGTFMVGATQVQTTSGTVFLGTGTLADNVKVEAEGHVQGGVLAAQKIEFK